MNKDERIELGKKLSDAVKGKVADPRLADVAYHFIHLAGGAKEFAAVLYQEFTQSPPGGVVRQRLLDMMLRCLKVANDQDPKTADLSLLGDEDLDRLLSEKLAEIDG